MNRLPWKSVRLKTLVVCTTVLICVLILATGAILYSLNAQYRAEYFSLYEKLFAESIGQISEDMVRAHTVLGSVASDTALSELLEDAERSPGEVVLNLQKSIKPLLAAQQLGLSGWCRLYVLHGNQSFPSMGSQFYYDPLCSPEGVERLRELPASGSAAIRRSASARQGYVYLYRPFYSRLTLKPIGIACVELDVNRMLRERMRLDCRVNAYDDAGEAIWSGGPEADGGHYRAIERSVDGLGLRLEALVPSDAGAGGYAAAAQKAILLVGIVMLILIASALVYVSFLMQLRQLIGDMRRIASGDRDARVRVHGKSELTQVAVTCNEILDEAAAHLQKAIQSARTEQKAVYQALSNQLRPHFLNNAIDSVRMQCSRAGDNRTADALTHIMRYLSYNLGRQDIGVTLTDELSSVSNYVEMLRLANESDVNFEITPRGRMYGRLSEYSLPKFTLQPIVENCVRHAFVGRDISRRVMITLEHEDGQIFISVEDNGVGMTPEQLSAVRESLEKREDRVRDGGMGISLNLVRRRLELYYDCEIPFTVDSYEGTGTMITFAVPDHWNGGENN